MFLWLTCYELIRLQHNSIWTTDCKCSCTFTQKKARYWFYSREFNVINILICYLCKISCNCPSHSILFPKGFFYFRAFRLYENFIPSMLSTRCVCLIFLDVTSIIWACGTQIMIVYLSILFFLAVKSRYSSRYFRNNNSYEILFSSQLDIK